MPSARNRVTPSKKATQRKLTPATVQRLSMQERLKLVDSLRGCCKGGRSMADELIKERRTDKW